MQLESNGSGIQVFSSSRNSVVNFPPQQLRQPQPHSDAAANACCNSQQSLLMGIRTSPGSGDFARRLTSRIKTSTSWLELQALLIANQHNMNHIHISAVVTHMPKVVRPSSLPAAERVAFERFLGTVSGVVLARVEEMDARALSNILWAAVSALIFLHRLA